MVLVAFSAFFKAKLKSWAAGPFNRPEILLSVPAGQLELGELLLQAMYQCTPDLGSSSQLQLLQLLALADRYSVNKVLSAAVAALQAVPQAELQWETDEQTKVAAENTVFRVIEVWHSHQQQHSSSSSDEELTQLLQQIRMQHCSQPFVATVLCDSPLVAQAFSPRELRLACLCSSAGGVQPDTEAAVAAAMQKVQCPVLARFPAWVKPKRPASAMTKLSMARQLSLADLQQQLEALQKAGTTNSYTTLVSGSWQGETFQARLCVTAAAQPADAAADGAQLAAANSSMPFTVGVYFGPQHSSVDVLRLVSFSVTASATLPALARRGSGSAWVPSAKDITCHLVRQGFSSTEWGWVDLFRYGAVDGWAAFEAKLRAGSLVHAGDCLHLKVEVTEVL
ncbi:hypothetical protein OEZ86_004372 [Tetradesmus obliquus]|nr:hypothetical protein OEZ86_004372 [Tetradesmus obliquus]